MAALAALVAAMLLLLFMPPHLIWLALVAAFYKAGNGVTTILRGTAIAELFGRERYAELNGALSAPAVIAKAVSPLALAALWSATGELRMVFAGACTRFRGSRRSADRDPCSATPCARHVRWDAYRGAVGQSVLTRSVGSRGGSRTIGKKSASIFAAARLRGANQNKITRIYYETVPNYPYYRGHRRRQRFCLLCVVQSCWWRRGHREACDVRPH